MAEHRKPDGIVRYAPGRYLTLDALHEIREVSHGQWTVRLVASGAELVGSPFATRGDAVRALAVRGMLPRDDPEEAGEELVEKLRHLLQDEEVEQLLRVLQHS